MNVWTWFAVPPAVLLAAHYALGPMEKSVPPLPAPPVVESLRLPPSLTAAASGAGYQRGGAPKDIRLAAFGIVVPDEIARGNPQETVPPARDLFKLESVLLAGDSRTATIDGKVYKEGDKFQRRYRLAKVEADAVWLKGPRGRETLRFPEFKDPPPSAAPVPAVALQAPGKPGAVGPSGTAPSAQMNADYRKILEMLKL